MCDHLMRLGTGLGLLMLVETAHAAVINVPADQLTIQAGIDAAVDDDVVIVALGTYNETIDFDGKAITVRSTDPDDPVVVMGTVINALGFLHGVTFDSMEGADSVLSGFVITGGNATAAFPGDRGGGVVIISASPTIENCTFALNQAFNGGGVYVFDGSPMIRNCLFSGNGAISGGACLNESATATYDNVQFCSNTATNSGGAVYNFFGDTTTLIGCTFSRNSAAVNGGGMFNDASNPTVGSTGYCGNVPNSFAGAGIIDSGGNSFQFCAPPIAPTRSCPADTDGDDNVGIEDFLAVLAQWGACP